MKTFELRELTEWKEQLERSGRIKPNAPNGGGYSTDDTRAYDRKALLLGMLLTEHIQMGTALKTYGEAEQVECVCRTEPVENCNHCRLVARAHMEYPGA